MQRYFSNLKQDNYLILTKEDLYHIKTVMRMKQGDNIEVVYDHKLHICQLDNDQALIKEVNNQITDKKVQYILCVPLLQEQKMSFVLQKATELGVDKIIPIIVPIVRFLFNFKLFVVNLFNIFIFNSFHLL